MGPDLLRADDLWLLNEGTHHRLADLLGAHPRPGGGTRFAVWAPNARRVAVVGDWNGWNPADELEPQGGSGVWAGVVDGAGPGHRYKYRVESAATHHWAEKADPVAFHGEQPPRSASIVWDLDYEWGDGEWMATRAARNGHDGPMSVYELHLGSWRHAPGELRSLNYRELAGPLADHVERMGFTHVELLPVMEHPYYGSWGYQTVGYFSPTSRFGTPQDFMALVDHLHQRGIGVLLDWVPSHFATDPYGLGFFDGTHLYEHHDERLRTHPDWGSYLFNYDRHEVRAFLVSSACFWLDRYHVDGLRVDAVASMLYLDYSRRPGEWVPNELGGNENLGALRFLKQLNTTTYREHPDTVMVAEESTAWPMVSRPVDVGGLGFGFKWDMGWMHDTLQYLAHDPVHRRWHHDELTFRAVYAFTENYVLPLSHDEVVHGKGSLLGKMPGDRWQRFANLRLLYGWQHAQPGKKLLFMGGELAQDTEWDHDRPLPWHLLDDPDHEGIRRYVAHLNALHRDVPALHQLDTDPAGFEWVDAADAADAAGGVLAFLRHAAPGPAGPVLAVAHTTPVVRDGYRLGVPRGGSWQVLSCSDDVEFGGSGSLGDRVLEAEPIPSHGRDHSLVLRLPPLGLLLLVPVPS